MKGSLDDRIARAASLAMTNPAAKELLVFYVELARFQKAIFEEVRASGETNLPALLRYFPALICLMERIGPKPLAEFHTECPEELLAAVWGSVSDVEFSEPARFYARVLLQPYAEALALRGGVSVSETTSTCPFCGARPVAGILRGEGDGAKRSLLCSMCATEWPYLRVLCPSCGERDKDRLPIYTAADFAHVRVDACDTCRSYIKSIDLTRDGNAVPVVDEIATVALNVWAEQQGYTKLEFNLLGM